MTNRGAFRLLKSACQSEPKQFNLALCTADNTPSETTNTFSELVQRWTHQLLAEQMVIQLAKPKRIV